MVEVGVGEQDRVELRRVVSEGDPVAHGFVGAALEHAAIDEDPRPVSGQEELGAGHGRAAPRNCNSMVMSWSVPPSGGRRAGARAYHRWVRDRWRPTTFLPRLPGLLIGLCAFGRHRPDGSIGLGLGPWEAFHQGLGDHLGVPLGTVGVALGIPILVLWWPLGERRASHPAQRLLIGTATNVGLAVLPFASGVLFQLAELLAGIVVIAIGSGSTLPPTSDPGRATGS